MVKTIFGIFLLLWGLGAPARALPPSDSPGMTAAAQDGAGTVWALPVDYNSDGTLRRRQAGTWAAQTIPGAAGFQARLLTRGENGAVYVFWQTLQGQPPLPRCLVTVHRGIVSRILARFSEAVVQDGGFPDVPTIYAGREGDVWLASKQALLWHISPDGSLATFPLKPEQYFGGTLPADYQPHTVASQVDGAGRRWFWQSGIGNWQQNGLRGVLIWDGKNLGYHPTLPGVPDRPFSAIAPLDENHVWLATAGRYFGPHPVTHGALYQVDTRTLSAVAETPPQSGAFQNIAQIFQANGDWYVVEPGQPGQTAALWRGRAGQWRKCLDKIDETNGYYQPDPRHPWLSEPSGVWLGVSSGAWWLPRSGQSPVWVNWRRGLAALNITGLFPLMDGSVLAVGPQGTTARMAATPQPIRPLPPGLVTGGMGAPEYPGPLLSDPQHHLWGTRTFYSGLCPLDEWDGKRWRTHLPPKSIAGINSLYACDTLGRLWLTTSTWNPPAQPHPIEGRAVYDPARDTWTSYATVPQALQAAASLPGMAFLPYRGTYRPPLFSGDGRVAYTDNAAIYFYNGQAWRHWEARDILPGYSYGSLSESPHFNHDGHLEVALAEGGSRNHLWDWAPQTGWQRAGDQSPEKYEDPVPPHGPHGLQATPVPDALGGKWFGWQDAVYTARHGLWVKQTELSGPNSPFRFGYAIEDVLQDPAGRLFFVTRPAGRYNLVVWSPPPVPGPTLSLLPMADDSVMVRVRAKMRGSHWFLWRLNGGAWSAPQTTGEVTLSALPQGDYRMEVQALDSRLLPSTPIVAVFSIRVAPATQIARWVRALLHGTNEEREAAVAGLIKQPGAALPALRAAGPTASEAGRWWLDAATQQIAEQSQAAPSADRPEGGV